MGWNLNPQGSCGGSRALARDDEDRWVGAVISGAAVRLLRVDSLRESVPCAFSPVLPVSYSSTVVMDTVL